MATQGTSNSQAVRKIVSAYHDADGTGDTVVLVAVTPTRIFRWGFTCSVALDAGSMEVVLDVEDAGSGANSVEIDSFVWSTDLAAGAGFYREYEDSVTFEAAADAEVAEDGTPRYVGPGVYMLMPGKQAVVAVDTAATAGDGVFWIEYVEEPFNVGSPAYTKAP